MPKLVCAEGHFRHFWSSE